MNDKDQKLIFEAYQQLNESLSVGDTMSAITNAWVKSDGNKEVYKSHLDMIKDAAGDKVWLAATGQIMRMPEQELDADMLEVIDSITDLDLPKIPSGSSFEQEHGHLDAVQWTQELQGQAAANADDLLTNLDIRSVNTWNSLDRIVMVFRALLENGFREVELPHSHDADSVAWALGNEDEHSGYAVLKFSTNEANDEVYAELEVEVEFETESTTFHLSNDTHVANLVEMIKKVRSDISPD